jgi:ABC-type phosphate transport system permease subunit
MSLMQIMMIATTISLGLGIIYSIYIRLYPNQQPPTEQNIVV